MNAEITMMLDATLLHPTEAFFSPWILFPWPFESILYLLMKYLFEPKPNKEMRRVAILGTSGAGKTTLWEHLRNATTSRVAQNTLEKHIEEFEFAEKANGDKVYIARTKDIPGTTEYIKWGRWKDMIESDTFVLFIFDVRDLDRKSTLKEVFKRIKVILMGVKEKELKNVSMYYVGTHLDQATQPAVDYTHKLISESKGNIKPEQVLIGDLSKRNGELYRRISNIIKNNICS